MECSETGCGFLSYVVLSVVKIEAEEGCGLVIMKLVSSWFYWGLNAAFCRFE